MTMEYSKINAYVQRLIRESTPERTIWNVEKIRKGEPANWNYIDGCMITALLSMAEITGDQSYFVFAESFIDSFISDAGDIRTYEMGKFSLDDVNEGRVLFELYKKTKKKKYRLAADRLREHLRLQPRTFEYNYWHKAIYPDQVWLDGIYMAQPFYVLYEKNFGKRNYSDIVRQIETVRKRMFCEEKGLYYHGYDASRSVFWADPVAMADIIEIIPKGDAWDRLTPIFAELMDSMKRYADPESGMYWQVVDQGGRPGNYLETSGSSMIAYAMLKGARLGVLGSSFADLGEKTFAGIADRYLSFTDNDLNLCGICLVAGLGPADNLRRDGSYEYYISEPVVENDVKGVAPFLLCYTEVMRRQNR